MVKRALLASLFFACAACSRAPDASEERGLVLHGFRLVDPNDQSVRERDVCVQHGAVCGPRALAASSTYPRIEGRGRFLLPALWDLNVSLWGNNSAKFYEELEQEMTISQCLRVELYYGVAHVGVFGMDNEWVRRELKRARALELPAAELLYPDKALAGGAQFACIPMRNGADVAATLDARKAAGAPFVHLFYCDPTSKLMPGLSRALLSEALTSAKQRGLRGYVFVDSWQRAREAAELGASLIYGLPEGPVPDDVLDVLRERRVIFVPALSAALELPRLLGDRHALGDPFLTSSVPAHILATFLEPKQLWAGWLPDLERGRRGREEALANVRRMAEAHVRFAQASDSGWTSGTFQGYSTHATQVWLERAGVDPWSRLAAVTVWPASGVGRQVGFAPGMPADFIALEANPLEQAANLRRMSFVVREGHVVDRATLAPDLERQKFHP